MLSGVSADLEVAYHHRAVYVAVGERTADLDRLALLPDDADVLALHRDVLVVDALQQDQYVAVGGGVHGVLHLGSGQDQRGGGPGRDGGD